ncbi:MAG: rhombotarget lipoprotein [Pseudomonadales bacterium]|nr:rhombotarget lipoprotein [Pseudomonadales bacterium]
MSKINCQIALVIVIAVFTASCTDVWHQLQGGSVRHGVSSSLVDYLYPNGEVPPEIEQQTPNLNLPLRVGLAFVPTRSSRDQGLSEASKNLLLEKVKASFASQEFIKDIQVIPDTYLRSKTGFQTIDQVARLYGLDVIALVSYDQVAHVDDNNLSILYWSVIGAYTLKGSLNEVQTFVDTAIFDVKTHKLLFRAAGVNSTEGSSTLVESVKEMRESKAKSFSLAMSDMTTNLVAELDRFKEKVKQNEGEIQVTHRSGYSGGGGALDFILLALLACLVLFKRAWTTRK